MFVGIARTEQHFDFDFTVFSKNSNCAAADIIPQGATNIYGVVYEVPENRITRESAKLLGRRSLDAIEGEGTNYERTNIELVGQDGQSITAVTYVVKNRQEGLLTSFAYVKHILTGAIEHNLPTEYRKYLIGRILRNNASLQSVLEYSS